MASPKYRDDSEGPIVPCIIDGKPVIQPSTTNFPVTSARLQTIIHHGQTASEDMVQKAIESAAAAFKKYRKTTASERTSMLLRAADLFEGKLEEAKHRQMTETSCDEHWAGFNASGSVLRIRDIASKISIALTGDLPPTSNGLPQLVRKEPVGPVLLIVPWNGALILGARGIASALAAGCTVVVKASELSPWTHSFLVETFLEAGFPPGTVNLVMADRPAGPAVTEALIAHPALRKIEFIGSAAVGKAIGAVAAKHLKPLVMELGDQSPAIILEDANLKQAAQICARTALTLHGQVCFSIERIIVHSSVREEFCRLLADVFENTPIAGYAVSNASAEKGMALVEDAVRRGATLFSGNNKLLGPASLSPSILCNVDREALISRNESFAPVVTVASIDTDEEAIEEANSRDGGLMCGIFTANLERALKMANDLEFGSIKINSLSGEIGGPVVGWKASGWGSHAGRYGIDLFLQHKSIDIAPSS